MNGCHKSPIVAVKEKGKKLPFHDYAVMYPIFRSINHKSCPVWPMPINEIKFYYTDNLLHNEFTVRLFINDALAPKISKRCGTHSD